MSERRDPNFPAAVRVTPPTFFYTLDQVAHMLGVHETWLQKRIIPVGRALTVDRDKLKVVNLAEPDEAPEWRVEDRELLRWLARHGVRIRTRR